MPINYDDYNPDFKEKVAKLKEERGNRCELCFAEHGHVVYRPTSTLKMSARPWYAHQVLEDFKPVKIIITTHHIDGDKKNDDPDNLLLACQRCHLRLDKAKHKKNSKHKRIIVTAEGK